MRAVLFLTPMLLLLGCPEPEPCVPMQAVFTDIDETLTTADQEWIDQLLDASHDPAMRPDAEGVMGAYADLGYGVFYVTARGDGATLDDGRTAREATLDWLEDHGFPVSDDRVFLAEGPAADQGWEAAWAYGNAETDIEAFIEAGIAADRTFLVGELAGTMGVQPLPDEEAYTEHLADHLPTVEEASCDAG